MALACAYYLLEPIKSDCDSWDFEILTRIISALLVGKRNAIAKSNKTHISSFRSVLFGYVNCVNAKWAIQLQNMFTILKVLALAFIIISGIGFYALGKNCIIDTIAN